MTITHHPDDALLLSYAAGSTNQGQSLIVAVHLTLCSRCRRVVANGEAAGADFLRTTKPEPLLSDAFESVLSRLDRVVTKISQPVSAKSSLPRPLQHYIDDDLDNLSWNRIGFGISYKPLFRHGATDVRLIRSESGQGVGVHTHRGEELTLVLSGGFTDTTGHYLHGDVQTAASDVLHAPLADEGEDCIVLAVTDAPLRFVNVGIAMLGKLFGF